MKHIITLTIFLMSGIWSIAQQVNPVPDYVFRNQMSVGRNAVTDTAAYFSIGPRYGATKGFMPPIVGDTATFSSGKRNGLLIFSVQKNKFLYWDSVRVQWSDMAGSSGAYIVAGDTSAMLAPYLRKADTTAMLSPYYRSATASAALALKLNISDTSTMLGNYVRHAGYGLTKSGQSFLVDTLNIATRAWRQKGLDSLAALEVSGSGTTNYVPKFTAGSTIGNSQIFDNGTNVGVGTASPAEKFSVNGIGAFNTRLKFNGFNQLVGDGNQFQNGDGIAGFGIRNDSGQVMLAAGSSTPQFRLLKNGRILINTTTDAGYQLDINGTLRSVNGANFATTSGNVGIGTASPSAKLTVVGAGAQTILNSGSAADARMEFHYNSGREGFISWDTDNLRLQADAGNYLTFFTNATERGRINSAGEWIIDASGTDAGDYKLQVSGNIYNTGSAVLAATSGNVGIGTASPTGFSDKIVNIYGATSAELHFTTAGTGTANSDGFVFSIRDSDGLAQIMHRESAALLFGTGDTEAGRINSSREWLLSSGGTDAGDYKLQVSGNIYNTGSAVLAATSGNVGVGVTPSAWSASFDALQIGNSTSLYDNATGNGTFLGSNYFYNGTNNIYLTSNPANAYALFSGEHRWLTAASGTAGNTVTFTQAMTLNAASELLVNTTSDAGDYKLQVVGNARIGTGKLDIASNTTFGIGVARSGTSEVAGQIYNSNGILYLGAESSAGGQIFSGSSAYAGVIGTGANYPLQFAVNNITRGGFSTSGNLLLGFTTDSYFLKLQVNGSIFTNNQFFGQGANAQLSIDSSTNISPLYVSAHSLTGSSAQGLFYGSTTWNTTGNPSLLDLNITNTASGATSNYIKITDGTNTFRVTKAAEVVTAAPSGGSIKPWKLGEAATVSPTSPNRTIRVEIDGTVYYLHAKTTND